MNASHLKYPLEERPTVLSAMFSLGLVPTHQMHSTVSGLILNHYLKVSGLMPKRVLQKFTANSVAKKKVCVYPVEYIPVMINIIKDYSKSFVVGAAIADDSSAKD